MANRRFYIELARTAAAAGPIAAVNAGVPGKAWIPSELEHAVVFRVPLNAAER